MQYAIYLTHLKLAIKVKIRKRMEREDDCCADTTKPALHKVQSSFNP